MAPQSKNIEVSGVSTGLVRHGSGKKVLYLHGANGAAQWLPFFDKLSAQYDLLIPDHPGFGRSAEADWIRSVPDLAMFYLDFLETIDVHDVHVVGTSLGGWIAAEIAARNANRLASLTLVDPAGIKIKGVPIGDFFIWSPEEATRKLFFDQTIADRILSAKLSDEQIDVQIKNRFAATRYCWQPRMFDPDLEKWLHRIKIPTQILWGENDELIPSQYAGHWQRRIAGSEMSIFAKCGHLPHLEAPDALFSKVQTMIDRVSA